MIFTKSELKERLNLKTDEAFFHFIETINTDQQVVSKVRMGKHILYAFSTEHWDGLSALIEHIQEKES